MPQSSNSASTEDGCFVCRQHNAPASIRQSLSNRFRGTANLCGCRSDCLSQAHIQFDELRRGTGSKQAGLAAVRCYEAEITTIGIAGRNSCLSRDVCAGGLDMNRVERLAGGHE